MTVRPKFNVVLKISASPANTRSSAHDWWHGDTYWQQLPFWQKLCVGKLPFLSYSSVASHQILLMTDFLFYFFLHKLALTIHNVFCQYRYWHVLKYWMVTEHVYVVACSPVEIYFEMGKEHFYHCPRKRFLKVALAPIHERSHCTDWEKHCGLTDFIL